MEILIKHELEKMTFNHPLDIDFKDFMNLYKKCTAKLYYFLVIDVTLASGNPLNLRKKTFRKKIKINQDDWW